MKKIVVLFIVFIASFPIVFSQDTDTLTLETSIELALENNLQYKAALLAVKSQEYKVKDASNPFSPLTIDVSSGLNQSDNLEKDNVYEADLTGNVSINASYTLSSTMFEQSYMETITLSIKKIEAEKTKYDVISNTKLAFLNVLVTQEILKFENFSFEKAKNYLEKASQKYELGWGTEEDKIRAEINLSNKEISYERAKSNLLKNKNRLFSSIGFDLITDENDNNVKIIGNLEYKPYITDVNSAVEQALSENLDLKALILSRQLLNANIDLLHLNKIPSLTINVGFTINWIDSYYLMTDTSSVYVPSDFSYIFNIGFTLSLPLDDLILPNSYIKGTELSYELERMDADIMDFSNELTISVIDSYMLLKIEEQNVERQAKLVELSTKLYEKATSKYNEGIIDFSTLQEAETEFRNANLSYLQSIYDCIVAKITFMKTIGDIDYSL